MQQMLFDSILRAGWDCTPATEMKIEDRELPPKGKAKPDFRDSTAMVAFRKECAPMPGTGLNVQREEFKRSGSSADWDHPYATMDYFAEAQNRAAS